jgi:hypothetical protein
VSAAPELRADSSRLLLRLFVAGNEAVGPGDSRAGSVIDRLLALTPPEIASSLREIAKQFPHSLPDVHAAGRRHAQLISSRIPTYADLSDQHQLLIGLSFTHQFSVEGAALCNPSIVANPIQDPEVNSAGGVSFILSVRAIGEGHQSSIGFRTGWVSADGVVSMDVHVSHLRLASKSQGFTIVAHCIRSWKGLVTIIKTLRTY